MNEHSVEPAINPDLEDSTLPIDRDKIRWGLQEVFHEDGSPVKDYRRFVAGQSCEACGRKGEHVRGIELEGWWCIPGQELSDAYLISLCDFHDRALASAPNKYLWWNKRRINVVEEACHFWRDYHMIAEEMMYREQLKPKAAKKRK